MQQHTSESNNKKEWEERTNNWSFECITYAHKTDSTHYTSTLINRLQK